MTDSLTNNRYKMFRNFMYNELGITRDDVMLWTKEAISERVEKLVGQISIDDVVSKVVARYMQYDTTAKFTVREAIMNKIYEQISIELIMKDEHVTIN